MPEYTYHKRGENKAKENTMRMSRLIGKRFREMPGEAPGQAAALLLRGGYLRENGLLLPGLRLADRIAGGLIAMAAENGASPVQPAAEGLPGVLCLLRNELSSYSDLPFQVWHQDHSRKRLPGPASLFPCFQYTGLHSGESACAAAYSRWLKMLRQWLNTLFPEEAVAHAQTRRKNVFFLPAESGCDRLLQSEDSMYSALPEDASCVFRPGREEMPPLKKTHTPGCRTIAELAAFLGVDAAETAKAVFYEAGRDGRPVMAVVRGDRDVNEKKLAERIGRLPVAADAQAIYAAGAVPGYASPIGLTPDRVRIIADTSAAVAHNLVTGANEADYHYRNFNLSRDAPGAEIEDIVQAVEGDPCPGSQQPLKNIGGYTLAVLESRHDIPEAEAPLSFTGENGAPQEPWLITCHADTGRIVSALIENASDQYGPKWPPAAAPWQVHLCAIRRSAPEVARAADNLYNALSSAGISVLYDDRNARPGAQFADADLIGIPLCLIAGERSLREGHIEWKNRRTGGKGTVPEARAAGFVLDFIKGRLGPF
jgi:prolyl-tRNA synthetase